MTAQPASAIAAHQTRPAATAQTGEDAVPAGWHAFLSSLPADASLIDVAEAGRLVAPLALQERQARAAAGAVHVLLPAGAPLPPLPDAIQTHVGTLEALADGPHRYHALAGHALLGAGDGRRFQAIRAVLRADADVQLFVPAHGSAEIERAQALPAQAARLEATGAIDAVRALLQADGRDPATAQRLGLAVRDALQRLQGAATGDGLLQDVLGNLVRLLRARQSGADPGLATGLDRMTSALAQSLAFADILAGRACTGAQLAGLMDAARATGLCMVEHLVVREADGTSIAGWWLLCRNP